MNHRTANRFVRDMLDLYKNSKELYEQDHDQKDLCGLIQTIKPINFLYCRFARDGSFYVVVLNMTPLAHHNYD